jgi:hypothetical protein
MNDSCGRRLWVDHSDSTRLYYPIVSAFGSFTMPSIDMYQETEIPRAKKVDYDKVFLQNFWFFTVNLFRLDIHVNLICRMTH